MSSRSPDSSVFHVTILDEGDRPLQEGSLEATPTSLVYTEETSLTRYSWPLKQLRKCEIRGEGLFIIEGGKLSLSGIGMYRFSTPHAKQIYTVVSRHMAALSQLSPRHTTPTRIPSNSYSETSPIHWKLNTSLSSDSSGNHSPVHRRSSSKGSLGNFNVELILGEFKGTERGVLDVTGNSVVYTETLSGKITQWPIEFLRRYGCEADIFTIETGRRCVGGPRLYNFRTNKAAEINATIKLLSSADRRSSSSMSPSPTDVKMPTPPPSLPATATPPRRGPLPPLPPSQAHPPLPPSRHLPPPSQPPLPLPPTKPSSSPNHTHNHTHVSSSHLQNHVTSAPFKRSDSLIRRAFSAMDIRKDVFEVRNISDDRNEVGQGTVEVTATDLIYVDAMTNEKWKWPFKFLRKYGFEGNIFTFEAGRRCPGGQGLYAFASERANEIHEAIVENIRGKKNLVPTEKAPSSTNPRFSLTTETLTSSPPIQLSNRNQYDITSSPGSTRKWSSAQNSPQRVGLVPQKLESLENSVSPTPPTTTPTSKEAPPTPISTDAPTKPRTPPTETDMPISSEAPPTATPSTKPQSQRPASTTGMESATSSLTSVSSDPIHSDIARFSGSAKSSTPSTSTEEDGSTSPVSHNLVKPVLEPVRAVQREHLYDVPQCPQMRTQEGAAPGSQATDASTKPGKGSTDELLSSSSGEHATSGQPRKSSKFGRKGSGAQDEHADVAMVVAQDGGRGYVSVKGGKKDKQNVLNWLRKKSRSGSATAEEKVAESPRSKSKKKKGRKKSGKGASEHEDKGHLSDEPDGVGVYENLKVAKLKKTAYSASCDNILESLSMEDSVVSDSSSIPQPSLRGYSIDVPGASSVPQPRLRGSASPASLSDDMPFSATPTMYQNLQEANADKENVVQVTPSPLYSNVELSTLPEKEIAPTDSPSPCYSNVDVSNMPEREPPPPKQMSYAVVDILSLPPQKAKKESRFKVMKQASLTSIVVEPPKSGSNTNRQRSQSTLTSGSSLDNDIDGEGVVYAKLDMAATSAVARMRAEHRDVRNFEDLLERHEVREMEMDVQRRRKLNIT